MAKYFKTEDGFQEIETINLNKMDKNNPVGNGSFSMGRKPGSKIGYCSHAEGSDTTASGTYSHAEGNTTTASGLYAHAEGDYTIASEFGSHAEGFGTIASGSGSHAEGSNTIAFGSYAHAEGSNTIANSNAQHVHGKFNVVDSSGAYAHIVGNGSDISNRSNAHVLDWNGNAYYKGTVYVNGTNPDASGGQEVATKSGWTANKYIGTDENGNLVEKDEPASGTVGYPVVLMTDASAELVPNTYYKWGEIAALTVTLATPTNTNSTNEYCFEFVSGVTETTLSVPDTVKWVKPPVIEAGKTYQVSILNGIGVICGA